MKLLFFALIIQFSQEGLDQKILSEVSYYIDNIEQNDTKNEIKWSLFEIYFSYCYTDISLRSRFSYSKNEFLYKLTNEYECTDNELLREEAQTDFLRDISLEYGLYELSISYLLKESEESLRHSFFEEFNAKWIKNVSDEQSSILYSVYSKNSIDQEFISHLVENPLVLYLILSSSDMNIYLGDIDKNMIVDDLKNEFTANNTIKDLHSSINLINTYKLLFNLNRYIELVDLYENSTSNSFFPSTQKKIRHIETISYAYYILGRYDRALELHRAIIAPIAKKLNNKSEIDNSIFFQGTYLYTLGKFKESKAIFEELYADSLSNIDKAYIFNNLSISYYKLGETNKYIKTLLDALDESEKNSDYSLKLTILSNLFFYHTSIGNRSAALDYLDLAEKTAMENDDLYQRASIHAFRAVFYWKTENEYKKALAEFEIAIDEFDPEKNFFDYTTALQSSAEIYKTIDSLDHALSILNTVRNISKTYSNSIKYKESSISIAEILLLKEHYNEAEKIFNELGEYTLNDLDFEKIVKYQTIKYKFNFVNSDYERKSFDKLKPVVAQIIERAKTSIDSQTGYWVQTDEYLDAFNTAISMLLSLDEPDAALKLLDEFKTINDAALYNSPILRANRLSEEDLARDNLLNNEILALRTEYLNENSDSERLRLKSEIDRLSADREEIFSKIRVESPSSQINIWNIQRSLSKEEQIIHFTEIGNSLYVSYLTRDNVMVKTINFSQNNKREFERIANDLASSNTDLVDLYWIYKFLGLEENIEQEVLKLVVIPDNFLYRIPIDVFPVNEPISKVSYGSANYLLEKYETKYFTSLNEFINNSKNSGTPNSNFFSAFAISNFQNFESSQLPSLPFAALEIQNIDEALSSFDKKNLFLEFQATKESFLNEASSSSVVHVATHSEVSEQDPLFSKIYLNSAADHQDPASALYAYELFDANLNNELIMLNSCSSGSGDYLQGTGIMGISRALRYAGANSLALNLWAVNDKIASDFAITFYAAIDQGKTKTEAIREAKLSLLQTGNANPHFWGAYMLIGNPSPLTEKPAKAGLLFPFLIVVVGVISIIMKNP